MKYLARTLILTASLASALNASGIIPGLDNEERNALVTKIKGYYSEDTETGVEGFRASSHTFASILPAQPIDSPPRFFKDLPTSKLQELLNQKDAINEELTIFGKYYSWRYRD